MTPDTSNKRMNITFIEMDDNMNLGELVEFINECVDRNIKKQGQTNDVYKLKVNDLGMETTNDETFTNVTDDSRMSCYYRANILSQYIVHKLCDTKTVGKVLNKHDFHSAFYCLIMPGKIPSRMSTIVKNQIIDFFKNNSYVENMIEFDTSSLLINVKGHSNVALDLCRVPVNCAFVMVVAFCDWVIGASYIGTDAIWTRLEQFLYEITNSWPQKSSSHR